MTSATKKLLFCVLQVLAAFYLTSIGKLDSSVYMWISITVTFVYVAGEISDFSLGSFKVSVAPRRKQVDTLDYD